MSPSSITGTKRGRIPMPPAIARPLVCLLTIAALPHLAAAQYTGQVTTSDKNEPTLRAVAVLEWTGDIAHPKSCRLVPITVYDGDRLQDGSIYLARPQPLALQSEVEYELLSNGKVTGLFDIQSAGREQGSWVGLGKWKALPAPHPVAHAPIRIDEDEDYNRGPILHRKAHPDESPSGSGASGSSGSNTSGDSGSTAPAPDPDRPTLHRTPSSGSSTGSSSSPSGGSSGAGTVDADRPKLQRKPSSSISTHDTASVESLPNVTDPNRPRLIRGKPADSGPKVAPTLMGLPREMQQTVAVSDARNRPEHLWSYSWANPGDAAKMKADLESMARDALGLTPPAPAAPAKPAKKARSAAGSRSKPAAQLPPPPPPAPLVDEQFRVFELAYGSGATMVFSARTDNAGADEKFVTLIAQPDLYGNVAVLLKNVTDAAHLDLTPRMKLIDAVDALADNRGELLFELRGATQRQFALYRVLRGQIAQIFIGSGGSFGAAGAH